MRYILSLAVAITTMIIVGNIIKNIANKIKVNKTIVTILVLLNIPIIFYLESSFRVNQYLYIESFILMFNYFIYILYLVNVNKDKTFKDLLKIGGYRYNIILIVVYSITYILDLSFYIFELPMTAFGMDAIAILILLIMRFYGYIYIHSVADKITEEIPEFISQFETIYIRSKEMEKKPAVVWLYYIIYSLVMFINKYPMLSTIITIIIFGPYLLISIESIRIANSIRKILKVKGFYNYNIFLGINLFIQVILICFLLLGVEYRWTELLRFF